MAGSDAFRTEHDSMGEVQVPAAALWGAQTQRAVENFPISGRPIDRRLIRALALIKAEAAVVNARSREVPTVDDKLGDAIRKAAEVVATGAHDDQFPIDVFPTAIHLAATEAVVTDLIPALEHLAAALTAKADEFADVVKAGRTHLMDAVPITLGQEFGGYATQVSQSVRRLRSTLPRLGELPIGGTAVGTGLNAPKGFGNEVVKRLAKRTGLPLTEATDHIAAQSSRDGLVEASGQVRVAAVALIKIANDIRWMASGPNTGLAEIHLPDLQPGSSIMPGKVNPVLCEAVTQVGAQVIGNDAAVAFSGSQGNFELNVFMPVMARNLLESIELVSKVSVLFADRCVAGITADVERCRTNAESSPAIATSLNPYLGYERTAQLIKESQRTGTPIRALVQASGEVSEEDLDRALDAAALTKGGLPPTP